MSRKSANLILQQLKKECLNFSNHSANSKLQLLLLLKQIRFQHPPEIKQYHNLLLLLLTYPENKILYQVAEEELKRCNALVDAIFSKQGDSRQFSLINSGIGNSVMNVSLSFDLTVWLLKNKPGAVNFFSIDADAQVAEEVFTTCLPSVLRDLILHKMLTVKQMINILKKEGEDNLKCLIRLIEKADCSKQIRDHLWNTLKIFISWCPDTYVPSITLARSPDRSIYFHSKPLKKKNINWQYEIRKEIKNDYKLTETEKHQLIATGRGVLASMLRETDPLTYADAAELKLFDMGRGIDIALYPMVAERRLALEAYIGYVAFKNRIPVAYGGGWVFLHRSKIGINVFPMFRSGESSFLFCQILRLYAGYYKVKKFVVEPYQFGKRNSEGIKSGAYWFYYRLGFRSADASIREMAEEEFFKISESKTYKTSAQKLKKFTCCNMELNISKTAYPDADPLLLSKIAGGLKTAWGYQTSDSKIVNAIAQLKHKMSERSFVLQLQQNNQFVQLINRLSSD